MNAIIKLDDHLINKIAAGEVIERPSSVIKELIENSLDAECTRLVITIKDGGKKLIKVVDDGVGIAADQLELAVSRHTTSKIKCFDDMYRLKTKGFRGEALASISSVSKIILSSRVANQDAKEIIVEGGQVLDKRFSPQDKGTTVLVKYLFYQTPVRLKFLKTSETETSHIVDVVTKMALSHPDVEFLLQSERPLFHVKKAKTYHERVAAIFGKDLIDYLYPVSASAAGFAMSGYIGHPQVARSQRSHSFLFVNGRSIQDKVLWHAIKESYRDLLMKGRHPIFVLNLKIDEQTIDVNVHPTKSEIRFHKPQLVHQFVYHALRNKLQESPWLQKEEVAQSQPTIRSHSSFFEEDPNSVSKSGGSQAVKKSLSNWSDRYFLDSHQEKTYQSLPKAQNKEEQKRFEFGKTVYADMTPIGQLLGTYILCEANEKLVLIDQHAAHERIGFEKLMLQHQEKGIESELLLIPQTFDLQPSDAEIIKKYLEPLKNFGFEIEFFGGLTFVLKALPSLLKGKIKIDHLIIDIVADIKETGELVSLKEHLHHLFATMACHAQIRAHHHLTLEEIQALLKELEHYQFTDFCPHGRPVAIEVSLAEIEKWFKRTL